MHSVFTALTVLGAAYGPRDVTSTLNSRVTDYRALSVQAANSIFGNSWRGTTKSLVVVYQHEGYEPVTSIVHQDNTLSILSRPAVYNLSVPDCQSYPLRIVGAAYGLAEVTGKVRSLVRNQHLDVVATNNVFRNSWPGTLKTLVVVYQEGNGPYKTKFVSQGNRLQI